mmetsp:Transcript_32600/g.60781  ORF Transcript_32600/g.60781 Transcript_32600/m.60781 type:complete len:250 (+) Transcript_32600:301-1050(+)
MSVSTAAGARSALAGALALRSRFFLSTACIPSEGLNSGLVGSISKSALPKTFAIRGSFRSTLKLPALEPFAARFAAVRSLPRTLKPRPSSCSSSIASSSKSPSPAPCASASSASASDVSLPVAPVFRASRSAFAFALFSRLFSLRFSRYCSHVVFGFSASSLCTFPSPTWFGCCWLAFSMRSSSIFSAERLKVISMSPSSDFLSSSRSLSFSSPLSSASHRPLTRLLRFSAPLPSSSSEVDARYASRSI